jgi:LCP family protein required for cell wall assembly
MKESNKKKIKWIIIAIVALIIVAISAVVVAVLIEYDKIHVKTKYIEYESEYVIPDLPSDIIDTSYDPEDFGEDDPGEITDPGDSTNSTVVSNPGTTSQSNTSKSSGGSNTNNNTIKDTPIYKVEQRNQDIINILLIGRDGGRSDTMIVASYNKQNGNIVLTSFMRDSLVYIQNRGWDRLGHSFAYGGPGLTINTINQMYSLDVQQFIVIDFSGFTKVIDNMGGITVNVTEAESQYLKNVCNLNIPAGNAHLNGSQALVYSRIRKGIGNDQARTERQRKVISAAITKVFNDHDTTKALSLLSDSLQYVKTNLGLGDMTSLLYDFMGRDNLNIDTLRVPADGTYTGGRYNGMDILKIDFDKNKKLIEEKIYK